MQKESEYEEATNHRAGGEGHSSRPHGLPHGTGHHLVHGLRPNDALTLIKPSKRTDSNVGLLFYSWRKRISPNQRAIRKIDYRKPIVIVIVSGGIKLSVAPTEELRLPHEEHVA